MHVENVWADIKVITRHPISPDPQFKTRVHFPFHSPFVFICVLLLFSTHRHLIPILSYEDNANSSVVLEKCVGSLVGGQVSKGGSEGVSDLKARIPNFVEDRGAYVPKTGFGLDCVGIGQVEFRLDDCVLLHSYLVPVVSFVRMDAPLHCFSRVEGGALLGFLKSQLSFQLVGVESDEEVLRVCRQYFGLEDGEHIEVCVGNALKVIDKLAGACEVENGRDGLIAPPLEFVWKHFLLSIRSVLCDNGILSVSVVPPNTSFCKTLIHEFQEVFNELFEIDVGNGENFILIAVASPLMPSCDCENCFLNKPGMAISGAYLNSIKNIFQVVGVEADEEVLRVSRRYFGLEDGEHIKICVGDVLKVFDRLAGACEVEVGRDMGSANDVDTKFDVIMVDLDSTDARDGLIAPPLEFARKHVLLSARSILSDNGILAINVIPPNTSIYKTLIHEFRDVFYELYEIDVGNGEYFILVAVASPLMPSSDCDNCFLNKLGKAISGVYLNSIKNI
ncbi:uncharacterized protein LOC133716343 [Rosa rugosa]|uniref:uncharacterized protein LOC133716343 n=1 Tax=Rosa rugosa TaxID=74645 RepID=UPI002B40F3BE|nr:uncharacterized protein LOC133716343 [Rosa rugosa]